MKTDEKKYPLYLCNPQKNTECQKTSCQLPDGCFLTTRKEFAVTDENENPIIAEEKRMSEINKEKSAEIIGNLQKQPKIISMMCRSTKQVAIIKDFDQAIEMIRTLDWIVLSIGKEKDGSYNLCLGRIR